MDFVGNQTPDDRVFVIAAQEVSCWYSLPGLNNEDAYSVLFLSRCFVYPAIKDVAAQG